MSRRGSQLAPAAHSVKLEREPERFHDPLERRKARSDASGFEASDRWLAATKAFRKVTLGQPDFLPQLTEVLTRDPGVLGHDAGT